MTELIYEPSDTGHWKTLFPKKNLLLGAHNLNHGEELIARILSVQVVPITDQNGQEERVPVLTFENIPPMVVNITNARTIASLYGDHYDDWRGKCVQVYAERVQAFGEDVDALRVRQAIPESGEDLSKYEQRLRKCDSLARLKNVFMRIPKHIKPQLIALKDELKQGLSE